MFDFVLQAGIESMEGRIVIQIHDFVDLFMPAGKIPALVYEVVAGYHRPRSAKNAAKETRDRGTSSRF